MKLILYQATIAITEIDFVPGPFRCQIELGHLDFAVDCEICYILPVPDFEVSFQKFSSTKSSNKKTVYTL